jgi:hypothetical protein
MNQYQEVMEIQEQLQLEGQVVMVEQGHGQQVEMAVLVVEQGVLAHLEQMEAEVLMD